MGSKTRGVHETWTPSHSEKISKYRVQHTSKVPAPDSFQISLAKKFKNLTATRDLVKTLRRDGSFEILILLRELKEVRSSDIESLIMGSGAAESSSIWARLRDMKAHGVVEEAPHEKGAKISTVKNQLTPAGTRLMDAFYELNKELADCRSLRHRSKDRTRLSRSPSLGARSPLRPER